MVFLETDKYMSNLDKGYPKNKNKKAIKRSKKYLSFIFYEKKMAHDPTC